MRSDDIGLFWQDYPQKRGQIARVQPPIPDTGWVSPSHFPDLSSAKTICLDVETYDPELRDHGPGWARGRGHLIGVSIGTEDGYRAYFPMRHTVEPEYNLDPEHVLAWLRHTLQDPRQPKVGANITYDVGWLREEGVNVAGKLYDVQFAQALLDEHSPVALEWLGAHYLGEGKQSNILYRWCADFYGGQPTELQRSNLYRAPPRLVGPYAQSDVDLPLRILALQWRELEAEGLMHVFQMECRLIHLLVEMRYQGVTVDTDQAERVKEQLDVSIKKAKIQVRENLGFNIDVWSNKSLAKAFDACGLAYSRTAQGNPSFRAGFLETLDHPLAKAVLSIRRREKIIGTFIDGYILDAHIDGKVYGQFHQLRGDGGGARSGRYSSSNPNLQNIPIRTDLGKQIRRCFVPDPGHARWQKYDYSQIEYRFMANYAIGKGAEELRARYLAESSTDYHEVARELILANTGQDLDRSRVKTINFALLYGMGKKTLIQRLGVSQAVGNELFAAYHNGAPFVKTTFDATAEEAASTGIVTTTLGRRSRFDLWEPGNMREPVPALPFQEAVLVYANPRRAYTHKALNRRLQGSAADLMKEAMLQCWEGGVFDVTGVPRLTVHDELDFSDTGAPGTVEGFAEMKHLMESAIPLQVPVQVDAEAGPSWGSVK